MHKKTSTSANDSCDFFHLRHPTHITLRSTAAAAIVALAVAGCGGGDSGPTNLACDAITTGALAISGLKVGSAVNVAAKTDGVTAGDNYPAHCQVQGSINERTGIDGKPYAIGYEIRLPSTWNGKFFFQGGGGTNFHECKRRPG